MNQYNIIQNPPKWIIRTNRTFSPHKTVTKIVFCPFRKKKEKVTRLRWGFGPCLCNTRVRGYEVVKLCVSSKTAYGASSQARQRLGRGDETWISGALDGGSSGAQKLLHNPVSIQVARVSETQSSGISIMEWGSWELWRVFQEMSI